MVGVRVRNERKTKETVCHLTIGILLAALVDHFLFCGFVYLSFMLVSG